jgi:chromate transporter
LVYALARITPGTNVLAFCAGSGWEMLGWRGAVMAVFAATVPSALVAVLLSAGYDAVRHHPRAMAAIGGTLAAAVGMMATGAWQLLAGEFRSRQWQAMLRAMVLAGVALGLAYHFRMAPIAVLALAGAAGFFWQGPARA